MAREDRGALTRSDPAALNQLRLIARVWDELIRLPVIGRRIGLDALVGLIPGAGDVAAAVVASWALVVANRLGAPPSILFRMLGNIAIDTLFGAIPLLGDLFDIGWRAQRRNVNLLERWLETPHAVRRSSRAILLAIAAGAVAMVVVTCWMAIVIVRLILGSLW